MEDDRDQLKKLRITENPFSSSSNNNNDNSNNNQIVELSSSWSRLFHESVFDNIPMPFKFVPSDEACVEFVMRKINNQSLLSPNKIRDVEIYNYTPDELAENFKLHRTDKDWFYFTPRDPKQYNKGNCTNRIVKDESGFWSLKSQKAVMSDSGEIVGFKNKFVFHRGKPSESERTNWFMKEYTLLDRGENYMRFDDWVLCKVNRKCVPSTLTTENTIYLEEEYLPSDYEGDEF